MSYHDPDLLPPDVPRLKKYTKYRCPVDTGQGHGSCWTGAMYGGQRPSAHLCPCGVEYVEVVEDGHTYRVSFETINPHLVENWKLFKDLDMDEEYEWHPVTRDTTDRTDAEAQWRQLTEWADERTEPIRNVRLQRAETEWRDWEPS